MRRPISQMLELQADRVEAVLGAHKIVGRVIGGTLGPRIVRFNYQPGPHAKFSQIQNLADDLALALQVPDVRISRTDGVVVLEFPRSDPQPITFSGLMNEVGNLPLSSMLLGLAADGAPLLARLSAPEVAQVLISGTTGAGKSVLLRTIALSLAMSHTPRNLGVIAIDLKNRTFPCTWPHLSRPVITRPDDVAEALNSLVHLMEKRDERGEHLPHLAILIDELADVVMQVEDAKTPIVRLLQRGREAGLHVIAATQHPSAAILSSLMRANFPLRLVGRVVSADDARMASGRAGTNAHLLAGRGDFLAVSSDVQRFQVPHVDLDVFSREIASLKVPASAPVKLAAAPLVELPRTGEISRAQADAEMLLARALSEERRWQSQNEAERWLCGYNGGAATTRTRAALEIIAKNDQTTTTTTTTTRALVPLFAQTQATAA